MIVALAPLQLVKRTPAEIAAQIARIAADMKSKRKARNRPR